MELTPTQTISFTSFTLDRKGQVIQQAPGQARQFSEDLGSGVHLGLIAIPQGLFQMGSHRDGGYSDELPRHPVYLASFWLGQYPVTQAQWQAVMGHPPGCRFHGPDLPVENITWIEADAFCRRLSDRTGRSYTLPSEAQWEYACRAGTVTPFSLGETITTDYANYVGEHIYAEEPPGVYRHSTTPGDSFPPNPWGLSDMHGNVWEFCSDRWTPDYSGTPPNDTPRPISRQKPGFLSGFSFPNLFAGFKKSVPNRNQPAYRVARGGSWHETPNHCRSAIRLKVAEDDRMEFYGFRVILKELPGLS